MSVHLNTPALPTNDTSGSDKNVDTRLNWRLLLGEFVVIVVGVLLALWVDQLREARVNAKLEVEYLKSLVTDLEADLSQFDTTEEWMRRQEAAAATVLALYQGSPPTGNVTDLIAAVETAGWQYSPPITRTTIDVLYQTIANRASVAVMRSAALELRSTLERWLASRD